MGLHAERQFEQYHRFLNRDCWNPLLGAKILLGYIKERTSVGRDAAKKRGISFGRPPKLNKEQKSLIKRLISEGKVVKSIAKTMNTQSTS